MEIKTGKCHCGKVEFQVQLKNGLEKIRRCNCSLNIACLNDVNPFDFRDVTIVDGASV